MTDEIASFKVTAADIQKQKVHPSGDAHMQEGSHFIPLVSIFNFTPNYHEINDRFIETTLIVNKTMHEFINRNILIDQSCFSRACALLLHIVPEVKFINSIYSKMATCGTSYMSFRTQH